MRDRKFRTLRRPNSGDDIDQAAEARLTKRDVLGDDGAAALRDRPAPPAKKTPAPDRPE